MNIFTLKRDTMERPSVFGEGDTLFRYDFAAKQSKNKRVLDIGTGYGDGAHYIFLKGAKEVIGIDFSKNAIDEARKRFIKKGLAFHVMDALNLQLPRDYFDVVVAYEIIEHLPVEKYKVFFHNIKYVLKKDGTIFISTPNQLVYSPNTTKPNNPYHIHEFTAKELEALLKKYFSKVTVIGIKTINKEFIEVYNRLGKSFRYKILDFIGKYRLVRELAGFIPKNTRIKITAEEKFPHLTIRDFKIFHHKDKRDTCLTLAAIIKR